MNKSIYSPGKLVSFRDRDWVVLPSGEDDLVLLKPLGGSDEEITGVYLPLCHHTEELKEARFPEPGTEDLGSFESARLLYNATRLSFRNASGPFRCMGKLGFRPRSYQVVPLVMALRQDITRLLIADDVGIGKTVEALMILKELMERGEIKRFAVICLPHLCEQWQQELKDKLDIEAEIIRSSTAAALDRKLPDDRSVFHHLPYQVISIDYIKSDKRKNIFLTDCPDLVIVDEAHTCARPAGSSGIAQQQRYHLLHDIAKKKTQHLLLLTATPHSGKDEEFRSLLGLLNSDFLDYDLDDLNQTKRRKIAQHFIQRKRENIARWHRQSGDEKTPFPKRDSKEIGYALAPDYKAFYEDILRFARGISSDGRKTGSTTIRYWAALALLRGVMSSPAMGREMLLNRQQRQLEADDREAYEQQSNPNLDTDETGDAGLSELIDHAGLDSKEQEELQHLAERAEKLKGLRHDRKAAKALELVKSWIKQGYHPIVFCKYIPTAEYLGELLKSELGADADVQVVTSTLADEQRRERIQQMEESKRRVLVATDCLSEGINLQHLFTAVLHYDLPWNPNRLEQREGRVDRFGQEAPEVKAYLLWGEDNPIDQAVLEVLIRKVRDIQRSTGVSISLGEEKGSVMEAVIRDVILGNKPGSPVRQERLFAEEMISQELEAVRKKAENLRSIFAHESVDPTFINQNLDEIDEAIGDLHSVEDFVLAAVTHLGGSVESDSKGHVMHLQNLPEFLKSYFPPRRSIRISFESPTPAGYRYIGRNHQFVEQLCQLMLSLAFEDHPDYSRVARTSVIRSKAVRIKTTLVQFRVRNVIKEAGSGREIISEEMYLWGYEGSGAQATVLPYERCKQLLLEASSAAQIPKNTQQQTFEHEQDTLRRKGKEFLQVAEQRSLHLVEAHSRFRELTGGKSFSAVYPILPPDIMGVYILSPIPQAI
jgi:superfamily II DNA or RNA helicase